MIQKYTQTTYETCLACSLLQAVDKIKSIKITRKLELACITHSMKFSKADFVIGHLDFIVKKFGVNVRRIVDSKIFYNYVKKIKSLQKIKTEVQKIDLKLIDCFLGKNPILYVDAYCLFKVSHYPHFITILEKNKDKYKIFDPWDGREKLIPKKTLAKAISSLRNYIKMCPEILIVG